ncbi:MAG: SpoIID/LytB domain-containing protein [Acidobacteriota bacterium]
MQTLKRWLRRNFNTRNTLHIQLRYTLVFLCLFTFFSIAVKAQTSLDKTQTIRVGLFDLFATPQLQVRLASGTKAFLQIGSIQDTPIFPGDVLRIRKVNHQLNIAVIDASGKVKLSTHSIQARIEPLNETQFLLTIPGKIHRVVNGNLSIAAQNLKSRVSLRITLTTDREAYVASVIAGEMSATREIEALKTLAVVARSFTISHQSRHRDEGFDFCDTTHCQVYRGEDDLRASSVSTTITGAVESTVNEVLTFNHKVIEAFYTAACGGNTATPATIWGGATLSNEAYVSISCQWCAASPYKTWQRQAEVAPTLAALSMALNFNLSPSTELAVINHPQGDIVESVRITDHSRSWLLNTEAFRRAIGRRIGWNRVLSPTFRIERRGNSFIFRGRGFGSQVGLCVAGTIAQAKAGRRYRDILEFYYPHTELDLESKKHKANSRIQDSGFRIQSSQARDNRQLETIESTRLQIANRDEQPQFSDMNLQSAIRNPQSAINFSLLPFAFWGVGRKLAELGEWLMAFGGFGLFAIALLDSALIPLPSGPDLVMIALSANDPAKMPIYALAATLGSTLGCTMLYLMARRAGMVALKRIKPERRERLENMLGRYDMLAVMLPAMLPPPFPFKPFILSAGVFKLKIERFILAIFIGRAIRFLVEGWLAIQFGDEAWNLIKRQGLKVLLAVALIIIVFWAVNFYKKKGNSSSLAVDEVTPQD